MKYLLTFGAVLFLLAVNVTSCKKGDHDPFFSLKTRTSRLTRKWVLSGSEAETTHTYTTVGKTTYNTEGPGAVATYTPPTSIIDNTVISFDGSTETTTETVSSSNINVPSSSSTFVKQKNYTEEFEFKKDGTFLHTKVDENWTTVLEGNWMFLGKNKEQKLKNKEAILLNYTKNNSTTITGNNFTTSQTGSAGNKVIYVIDELKSKEIIFINEYSNFSSTSNETTSGKTTMKLKAK